MTTPLELSLCHKPLAVRREWQQKAAASMSQAKTLCEGVQAKCAERGPFIPRVAFLFMTRGNIWHEAMWKAWFRQA
jgi:hypothetical protein